jgi:hypothetical protein
VLTDDFLNVLAGVLAGIGAYAFYNSVLPEDPGLLTAGGFVAAAWVLASISEGDL